MANYNESNESDENIFQEIDAAIAGEFQTTQDDQVDAFLSQLQLPEDEPYLDPAAEAAASAAAQARPPRPQPAPRARAYNRDYGERPAYRPQEPAQAPVRARQAPVAAPPKQARRRRRRRHGLLRTLGVILLILALLLAALWFLLPKRPDGASAAFKEDDVATILIAGTDLDGYRTDTMMLLYLNNDTGEVNLLSIPRDTRVVVDGESMKLNAVYGYGGQGEDGMQLLLHTLRGVLSYEPDAYVLVDFESLEKVIDTMGGIEFDVPCDMHYDDPAQDLHIDLSEGLQHLDGEEAVHVLRFRSGYAMADLERVNVQRKMVAAAMEQWLTFSKLPRGLVGISQLTASATTNLSARNLLWIAKSIYRIGLDGASYTLPGSWDSPYYYLDTGGSAEILNDYFNPTGSSITSEDLEG